MKPIVLRVRAGGHTARLEITVDESTGDAQIVNSRDAKSNRDRSARVHFDRHPSTPWNPNLVIELDVEVAP